MRPLAETDRAGERPASVGSDGCSARSHRPTSESGTYRLTPSGSARPPSDGRSADAPANTPHPSPRPTKAWPGLFRLPDCGSGGGPGISVQDNGPAYRRHAEGHGE
jgi:hypothetical protein